MNDKILKRLSTDGRERRIEAGNREIRKMGGVSVDTIRGECMVEMEGKRYTDTDRVYRRNTLAAVSLTGKRESNRQQISSEGEEPCGRARLSSSRARTAGHAKSVKRPHSLVSAAEKAI